MKIKIRTSMGLAGSDESWTEDIPENVVEQGEDAISTYIEELEQDVWQRLCDQVSVTTERL